MKVINRILLIIFVILTIWLIPHLLIILWPIVLLAYTTVYILFPGYTGPFTYNLRAVIKNKLLLALFGKNNALEVSSEKVQRTSVFIKNILLILLLTFLSFIFLSFEASLLSKISSIKIERTALITARTSTHKVGEVFPLEVLIENIENPINAAQTDLTFDPKIIQAIDISTEESFAEIFLQKEIDNENGLVIISGGLPNPGFSGENCKFATVLFMPLKEGETTLQFSNTSMVLANDGRGTNILKNVSSVPIVITDGTKPDTEIVGADDTKTPEGTTIKIKDISNYQVDSLENSQLTQTLREILSWLERFDRATLTTWYNVFKGVINNNYEK